MQVIKAVHHLATQETVRPDLVDTVIDSLGIRDVVEKPVFVDFGLTFAVRTKISPILLEGMDEGDILDMLMDQIFSSPETLTKQVAEAIHQDLRGIHKLHGDVVLNIELVYDPITPDQLIEAYEKAALDREEGEEGSTEGHKAPPMSHRPSGLPVILDADSDPMNRVLGMEFPFLEHTFKAAFANGSGTVIHLYEKVGKKWRPLCNRRNAMGPNGISIQSSRDHRKWCEQCETKYANKVVD